MLPPHMDRLHQSHASEDRQRAVLVTLLSFLSYGLMLGVGIVLGRALGAGDYGHYSTAVALASVMRVWPTPSTPISNSCGLSTNMKGSNTIRIE